MIFTSFFNYGNMFIAFLVGTIVMILMIGKFKIRLFSMYFFIAGALTPLISTVFCYYFRNTALPAQFFWIVSPLSLVLCVLSSIAGIIEVFVREIPKIYLLLPTGSLVCSFFLGLFLVDAWAMVSGA